MSLFTLTRKKASSGLFVKLELKGTYQEIGSPVMSMADMVSRKNFRFDLFYEQVIRIIGKSSIRRVLVHRRENFRVAPFGALEEVRAALQQLTAAGLEVWYYAPEYTLYDCVLASACSHRVLHPLGQVAFGGLSMSSVFFKNWLTRHQVEVTVIRRHQYKSAADVLRSEQFDEHARRQYQQLLDEVVGHLRQLAEETSDQNKQAFTAQQIDEMLDGHVFHAEDALQANMVGQLTTPDEITRQWKEAGYKKAVIRRLQGRFGSGPRVAVLVFEGAIIEGSHQRQPLLGNQGLGDRPMIRHLRKLRESRKVKAVVFRINSGGGSPIASENILRELEALHQAKPLVISMGPVAASGGYWIAATGRYLFALSTTITGSIGVLSLFFNLQQLLHRQGITTDAIRHGRSADLGSALRPLTPDEYQRMDDMAEFLYRKFLERVGQARNMTPEQVHELARGRVWSGQQAKEQGLVDGLGGLNQALAHVQDILGADTLRVSFEPRRPFLARVFDRRYATRDIESWVRLPQQMIFRPINSWLDLSSWPSFRKEPASLARACLAVHARPLLWDPLPQGLADLSWWGNEWL